MGRAGPEYHVGTVRSWTTPPCRAQARARPKQAQPLRSVSRISATVSRRGGWVHSGPESGLAWPHVVVPLYFRGELALYSNNTPSLCLEGTHSVPKTFASTPEGGYYADRATKSSNLQFFWILEWGQNEGCRVRLGGTGISSKYSPKGWLECVVTCHLPR